MPNARGSSSDWKTYRESYRALQRLEARSLLLDYFDDHRGCTFEVGGKRMSGREIASRVYGASDAQLRAFHRAAEQHRREKVRRS